MIINVLTAFLVVTLIGLVAALLLALASHFLSVKEDETVKLVRDCLPGANCGACGFAGCDEYAKAVASGEAKTNLCIPGADAVAKDIANVLGVEAQDVVEMMAFVACNGNSEATNKTANYDGVPTCKAASMVYAGPNDCKFGCLGCGDCAKVCPVNAICTDDGIAKVNKLVCSSKDKGGVARKKCKNACIGCKKCELGCPQKAITVIDNLAVIDYTKCNGCGLCADNCPTKCIKHINE